MSARAYRLAGALILLVGLSADGSEVVAQEAEDAGAWAANRIKAVQALRVEQAPRIDGVLDDEAWTKAPVISDFSQLEPVEFGAPFQPTEVRIVYDDENLYISAWLANDSADQITAQLMVPVQRIGRDDRFAIVLDPFLDRRNGYYFEVNPHGIQADGLLENNLRLLADWEGIWQAEAVIGDDGWRVEIAIPFATVAFRPDSDTWGLNLFREYRQRLETQVWSNEGLQQFKESPAFAGTLYGLSGMDQGLGLDVVPSVTVQTTRDFTTSEEDTRFEPSLDLAYRLTPSLTGRLTLNTDFAATAVDDRQVNLSRFSLFFPERREFFLQDAGIFEFARLDRNGRPFFSRTIGLTPENEPLNLNYGGKLTGRAGEWNIGFLAVQQEESEVLEARDAVVARVARNVLSGSSIGILVTDGDPRNDRDARTLAADFRYRNDTFLGNRILQGEAWVQQTDNDAIPGEAPPGSDDTAWGVRLEYPDDRQRIAARYYVFGEDFDPAMGFANRTGIDELTLDYRYRFRPTGGRLLRTDHSIRYSNIESSVNDELSRSLRLELVELETLAGDQWQLFLQREREVLVEGFDLVDRLFVPPGDYEFTRYGIDFTPARYRVWELGFRVTAGDFLDGSRFDWRARVEWKPRAWFNVRAEYIVNDLSQGSGDFTAKNMSLRSQIAFTSKFSFVPLVQFDNVSNEMGIDLRLRWQPERGQDLFFVWNRGLLRIVDERFDSISQDTVLKGIYAFRF